MDLLNGSAKYQRYLDRIEEYKKIVDRNQAFSAIQTRVDQLSIELKTKNDRLFYRRVHLGLVFLSAMTGIIAIAYAHYALGVLLIVGAVAFRFLYTRTLTSLIHSTEQEHRLEESQTSLDLQLFHKMQYLKHGLEVKMTRISLIRNGFMVLFPLVMLTGSVLTGALSNISIFAPVIVSFMMGTIFWFYFFKDDLDDLDYEDLELETYINDFLTASEERLTKGAATPNFETTIIDLDEDSPSHSVSKQDKIERDPIQLSLKI